MNPLECSLKEYIETVARMQRGELDEVLGVERKLPAGMKFYGVEDFILTKGRSYPWKPLPAEVEKMPFGYCFHNAYMLAASAEGLRYVEGYAAKADLPIPIAHAWCVNGDGTVIDPTWEGEAAYYGVEIPLDYVEEVMARRGCYGVLDAWEIRYPLLTGEDCLEDWGG